jgi:hypothetical protein
MDLCEIAAALRRRLSGGRFRPQVLATPQGSELERPPERRRPGRLLDALLLSHLRSEQRHRSAWKPSLTMKSYLKHPDGIEAFEDFIERMAVQLGLAYLDAIEATTDPKQAAELAEAAATVGQGAKSATALDVIERCHRAAQARTEPRIVCPTIFVGKDPPPRRWIVPQWIPYGVVTGLYGDGGVGKSLLAQQLQTGTALGTTWIGLPIEQIVSLGVYCEDDEDELRRRQRDINAACAVDLDKLDKKLWMPRLGEDNVLMTFARRGMGELTKFHGAVLAAALDLKARLVIIDTVADTFGGNENDRGQVRQFVQRALGSLARKIDGAVVCLAHPSRAGLASGDGDSGSTGWSNAFRSRLYLSRVETERGEVADFDARMLDRRKANYAARGDQIRLRWRNGVIFPDGADAQGTTSMGKLGAEHVFLELVSKFDDQRGPVSSKSRAGNYAPRGFERLPAEQRLNFRRRDFEKAMNSLFMAGRIENTPYGRKGDERTKIVLPR